MTRNDIYKIFREYENERVFVPCVLRSFEYRKYCAQIWTLHTMQNILLEAFAKGPCIMLMRGDAFIKFLDDCCTKYPVGDEINTLFSVCYDTAIDIMQYFIV